MIPDIAPKVGHLAMGEEEADIELVGFDVEEERYKDIIHKELKNFACKTRKLVKPISIKFHLRKLKEGGKPLYEIDGRVIAGGKVLEARITGYELIDLVQELINKLEAQVRKVKN
ncbi:MAG: hypothetical protein KAU95_04050 [Candidatus Aenigmarchaeota archaeon]|nr:hypothetical protein [Candidatus Aenigmarchaeota archaeon]